MTCSTSYCLCDTLRDLWNIYVCMCVCVHARVCVYACMYAETDLILSYLLRPVAHHR